jgi:hypothetical protein
VEGSTTTATVLIGIAYLKRRKKMSRYSYWVSQELEAQELPFSALIMAAMRKADTGNLQKLAAAFPVTHDELRTRYNSVGGFLPGEEGFTRMEE